ncbi:Isocitrate dehydrogenase (NAD(+)) [Tepidanaerobacter acetatoxydans Re1]|uniref:Isocitrate dehydrogenase (NAD(+)) n=1 Tax=Tepidanaerobacter acetatoxydans (strain DSM 21804 / JCM 16047 / Re1) TaxID=1209989 RepID=F4LSK7_TEPAE|nr:isocitrate/isopropylmalate family dehydrogenase [Tepidanaerobacter acetatoxydans]AEE92397.1 Isocitrate dehydrogenase (NAD(+)) [Tepidanaerobacter acetatoxydans Re1]CDI40997.1 Isocitrate dehydrogenase (NAD(+)) [Tepidanaerobacter acetatoxydans Re1]
MNYINEALKKFESLIDSELKRIEKMKSQDDFIDYKKLDKVIIGILPGDGVGPIIMKQALRVLNHLLQKEIAEKKIEIRIIDGLTIENRSAKMQTVPDDVLEAIKKCNVILKGPTVTPKATDPWPNLPSANATLRRELDLFANLRPVKIPEKNIDWAFFRENIEGAYILGSKGIQVNEDLAIDFVVETKQGSDRIARAAFEYAKNNGKKNITVVTKANIVKLTDGNFIKAVRKVGQEYPDIDIQERYVDATAAKLNNPEFNKGLEVFVLPNLYGDIITDIAAEIQGGLGTAGSANIGKRYAVFEAIHGTAPDLINNGRGDYANPCSLLRAVAMLLSHIGYNDKSFQLDKALEICTITERKVVVTTKKTDASAAEFTDYLLETLKRIGTVN